MMGTKVDTHHDGMVEEGQVGGTIKGKLGRR